MQNNNNNNNNNNKYINIYIKVQLVKESNRRTYCGQAGANDLAAKLLKRDYSFHLQRSNG